MPALEAIFVPIASVSYATIGADKDLRADLQAKCPSNMSAQILGARMITVENASTGVQSALSLVYVNGATDTVTVTSPARIFGQFRKILTVGTTATVVTAWA